MTRARPSGDRRSSSWVAASDLDITHIVNPTRKLLRRVTFFEGEVEALHLARRHVRVVHSAERHPHELEFDHLVIALGSLTKTV